MLELLRVTKRTFILLVLLISMFNIDIISSSSGDIYYYYVYVPLSGVDSPWINIYISVPQLHLVLSDMSVREWSINLKYVLLKLSKVESYGNVNYEYSTIYNHSEKLVIETLYEEPNTEFKARIAMSDGFIELKTWINNTILRYVKLEYRVIEPTTPFKKYGGRVKYLVKGVLYGEEFKQYTPEQVRERLGEILANEIGFIEPYYNEIPLEERGKFIEFKLNSLEYRYGKYYVEFTLTTSISLDYELIIPISSPAEYAIISKTKPIPGRGYIVEKLIKIHMVNYIPDIAVKKLYEWYDLYTNSVERFRKIAFSEGKPFKIYYTRYILGLEKEFNRVIGVVLQAPGIIQDPFLWFGLFDVVKLGLTSKLVVNCNATLRDIKPIPLELQGNKTYIILHSPRVTLLVVFRLNSSGVNDTLKKVSAILKSIDGYRISDVLRKWDEGWFTWMSLKRYTPRPYYYIPELDIVTGIPIYFLNITLPAWTEDIWWYCYQCQKFNETRILDSLCSIYGPLPYVADALFYLVHKPPKTIPPETPVPETTTTPLTTPPLIEVTPIETISPIETTIQQPPIPEITTTPPITPSTTVLESTTPVKLALSTQYIILLAILIALIVTTIILLKRKR